MAHRRLFSPDIVASDAFLEMPISSQALYFHLGMHADDDGFVNPKKIMRMIGSPDDDLKILLGKRFLLSFNSGVVVIKHWLIHNTIRKDRYNSTRYVEEKSSLRIKANMAYTDDSQENRIEDIIKIEKPEWLNKRQQARKDSSLPDSFDYKIRRAFIGKLCPICQNEMKEISVEDMVYTSKSNPMPSIQHNIPISQGGKHEIDNISVICHSCNVSTKSKITGKLNNKEVIEIWNTIVNQSAT